MTQVRLLPSMFYDAQEWNRGFMSRLAVDRLGLQFPRRTQDCRVRRKNLRRMGAAGQRPARERTARAFYGTFSFGQRRLYASTGVGTPSRSQAEWWASSPSASRRWAENTLSAFPTEFWDRLDARQNVWAPFYTVHKIMAGMFDMYRLGGNAASSTVLEGMAAWADEWTASKTEEHVQQILQTEYGGMNEVLYNLAAAPTTTIGRR